MEERIPYAGETIRHRKDISGKLWRTVSFVPAHRMVQIQREKYSQIFAIPLSEVTFITAAKKRGKVKLHRQRVAIPDDF